MNQIDRYFIFLIVFVVTGCNGSYKESLVCNPDLTGQDLSDDKRELLPLEPTEFLNHDDTWAKVAREVPGGWGGYFLDEGRPTIYLVELAVKESAILALEEKLPELQIQPAYVAIQQGLWDFSQLYDWSKYIQATVGWSNGVISSDIDETKNRLVYGVDEDELESIKTIFESAELPCGLVELEIQEPVFLN